MREHSWANVRGSFTLELSDGCVYLGDLQTDVGFETDELEFLRPFVANPDRTEISINFVSSGYYSPASMHGGSDGLGWPEEGSDDRELQYAEVLVDGGTDSVLPPEIGRRLFDLFQKQTDAVELEFDQEESE